MPAPGRDGIRYVVADYVEQRAPLIEDHDRRTRRIEDLVRQGKISYIGVELAPNDLREAGGTSGLLRTQRDAQSALSRRGVSESDRSRFLTSGSIGAGSHLWLSNETVRSRTRYVPLEDDSAKASGLEQLRNEDSLYTQLPDLVASGAISKDVARSLQARANTAVRDRRPLTSSEIHGLTSSISNPAGATWARSLLNGTNSSLATFDRRESQVVTNALAQNENGLISFGSAHRTGIIQKLETECRRMDTAQARSNSTTQRSRTTGSSPSSGTSRPSGTSR